MPLKTVKPLPKPAAKPAPEKTQPQLHGRTPTTGPEVKRGTARVDTGGAQGFGARDRRRRRRRRRTLDVAELLLSRLPA